MICEHPVEDSSVTVIDFGFCDTKVAFTSKYCGSLDYASPEVLKRRPYSGIKADIWNLVRQCSPILIIEKGIIVFALVYGLFPYTTNERVEVMRRKIEHPSVSFPESPTIAQPLRDLLTGLLHIDPLERLSLEEALDHPYFQD